MLASFVFFSSLVLCIAVERDVTRDYFGDIFRMKDCHVDKRTPCDAGGSRYALEVPGRPCYCQCAPSHFTYREDRAQCVREIRECYMSVFYRPHSVESIPLVFLPTSGQLVHPDAHLSLAGRRKNVEGFPKCKAAVSQYMTNEGWKTISREGSHGGSIFGLFLDGNKTFLQFLGNSRDRHTLQQHLLLVRLYCKLPDYAPFETCVAVRIGWSPGVDPMENPANTPSKTNMMVVGLSLGILGLVYVLAVLVYLKIRRRMLIKGKTADGKGKPRADSSDIEQGIDPNKRLDMYHTHTLGYRRGNALGLNSWGQRSSVEMYNRNWADRPGVSGSEFQAQDFQLQPEFFEPEFLASPPKHMVEFLERLQTSVAFARHRLRNYYRYRPTLIGIPEDDYFYQEQIQDESKVRRSIKFNHRSRPDGCSSSSFADTSPEEAPKPPPRKSRTKRKFDCTSAVTNRSNQYMLRGPADFRNISVTEEEKEEIQSAMDTLNDTLEALELDIFQQDLRNQTSDISDKQPAQTEDTRNTEEWRRTKNPQVPSNKLISHGKESLASLDVDSDNKDFESSSCSSLSAVTVLNHNSQIPETTRQPSSHKFSNFHGKLLAPIKSYQVNAKNSKSGERENDIDVMNDLSNSDSFQKQNGTRSASRDGGDEESSSTEVGDDSLEMEPVRDTPIKDSDTTGSIFDSGDDSLRVSPNLRFNEAKSDAELEITCSNSEHKLQNEDETEICPSDPTIENTASLVNCSKERNDNMESYQRCKETEIVKVEESLRKYKYKNKLNIRKNEIDGEVSNTPIQSVKRTTRKLKRHNGKRATHNGSLNDVRSASQDEVQLTDGNIESAILEILQKYRNRDDGALDTCDGGTETEMTEVGESDLESVDSIPTKLPKANDEMNDLKRPPSAADSVRTNITQDSLDFSRSSVRITDTDANESRNLVDAWISRLSKSSAPSLGNRSKGKKSTPQADNWTHICDKQNKEPCPVHENIPSLIDKLAHCSLKAMSECDVATYFQTLKQDVLAENLRSWIASHQNIKSSLSVSSRRSGKDSSQRRPLLSQKASEGPTLRAAVGKPSCDCKSNTTWSSMTLASEKDKSRDHTSRDEKLENSTDCCHTKDLNLASEIQA